MNKKVFIGATLITATVVGGVVYFRHEILKQVDKWLDDGEVNMAKVPSEARPMTTEEAAEFEAALKQE